MAVLENRAGIEFIQVKQVFVWDEREFASGDCRRSNAGENWYGVVWQQKIINTNL